MTATFPLARALERGACAACSTPRRIVFHHEGGRCGGRPVSRELALQALPALRRLIGGQ